MPESDTDSLNINLRRIGAWGLGGLFIVGGVRMLFMSPLAGLVEIILGVFITPYGRNEVEGTIGRSFTTKEMGVICIALFLTFGAVAPADTDQSRASENSDAQPTTTNEPPSISEIEDRLQDRGLVVLLIEEENDRLRVVTELQHTKDQDQSRIEEVAEVYARAVAEGYQKSLRGVLSTVDGSDQVQYSIVPNEARQYNQGEIELSEYLRKVMRSYCCR